ncbi:MAG: UDP-N-acetylmuramoyl-L-alanine--D-glutamate ligase [bacterium]|nr:UDP-N-acetylmuramoyl-L-alanine--D-glutamate ligase [bacterium]MDY4098383.1 UDP-N-acetylmuramoyl-L-alanine--D-glutamate ligase [Lachnospiraceae bacterium]
MDLQDKRVLVVGTGISGIAAAELLFANHIAFDIFDGNEKLEEEDVRAKSEALKECPVILGTLPAECMDNYSYVILSPGVPTDLPMVDALRAGGAKIWGEIELAYAFSKGDVLAITGTNGKTTTTALTGAIMRNYAADVQVVGNIGIPYTRMAPEMTDETVTVAEISSFQLETVEHFAPKVSAILNITPDHLNRHHTMENYIAAKERITEGQQADQVCVLNYEDAVLRAFGEELKKKMHVLYFSSARELADGLYLKGEEIYTAKEGCARLVCNVNELNLLGKHNYENVMAATGIALSYGVPLEKIKEVLVRFTAVEHRIEYVTEVDGVRYYNDSKGTNPDAAIQGIRAMNRPTCLIGGGYDKQSEYDEWIAAFDGKVKKLVLIGATAQKIADTCERMGFTDYVFADSLQEAVDICHETAVSGDAVLLSPACASWGMFDNYEQRGCMFKDMVRKLKK